MDKITVWLAGVWCLCQGYPTVMKEKVHCSTSFRILLFFCSAGLLWGRPRLGTWPFSESCASFTASMGRGEDACKCVVHHTVSSECATFMVNMLCGWWSAVCEVYAQNLRVCRIYTVCTDPTVCGCCVWWAYFKFTVGMVSTENNQCPYKTLCEVGTI